MLACSLFVRPIDFMNYKGAIYDGKLNSVNTLEETSIKYHHFVVILKNLRERASVIWSVWHSFIECILGSS